MLKLIFQCVILKKVDYILGTMSILQFLQNVYGLFYTPNRFAFLFDKDIKNDYDKQNKPLSFRPAGGDLQ